MSSHFQVGDEVVCIDVDPGPHTQMPENLKKLTLNALYTISSVGLCRPSKIPFVTLIETDQVGITCLWEASRFRKVQKQLTGMSVLRGLLKTKELVDG